MAMATYTGTCSCCGEQFTTRRKCYNRSAANDFEEWARENITLCGKCYADHERESRWQNFLSENEEIFSRHPLPVISTGSEKQIKYAEDLRRQALVGNSNIIKAYWDTMDAKRENHESYNREAYERWLEREGLEESDESFQQLFVAAMEKFRKTYGVEKVIVALTETNAKTIIDTLR